MQQIERHKTLENYAKGYISYPANHFNSTIESLCEQNLNNEHLEVESITQLSIENIIGGILLSTLRPLLFRPSW